MCFVEVKGQLDLLEFLIGQCCLNFFSTIGNMAEKTLALFIYILVMYHCNAL